MSAARLARGFTGRDLLIKFAGHYHGHADFFLVQAGSGVFDMNPTSSSAGIPSDIVKHTACLTFNDIEGCKKFLLNPKNRTRIAGVILEPIAGNMGCVAAKPEFLQMLRDVTKEIGALLIFDEVMTGFRLAPGGAQELYGVKPDMTTLGKIIGGGLPVGAYGGKKEIMDSVSPLGKVYQAGTLSGNPLAMAAGLAMLQYLKQNPDLYQDLDRKTNMLAEGIRSQFMEKGLHYTVNQIGSMFTVFFTGQRVIDLKSAKSSDTKSFAQYFQAMLHEGVYLAPSQFEAMFISTAINEPIIDRILQASKKALQNVEVPL
jgi:glutamate-1-semialdehyde 2,1-aminomutase